MNKKWYVGILVLLAVSLAAPQVLADASPSPAPSPVASVASAPAPQPSLVISQIKSDSQLASLDVGPFLSDALQGFQAIGGASGMAKIAIIILLLIASMKVNLINNALWSKIPDKFKGWLAPGLGLLAGLLLLPKLSLAAVMAYVVSGGGAVALHEILDLVKLIPGIGSMWVSLIDIVEGALNPAPATAQAAPPAQA